MRSREEGKPVQAAVVAPEKARTWTARWRLSRRPRPRPGWPAPLVVWLGQGSAADWKRLAEAKADPVIFLGSGPEAVSLLQRSGPARLAPAPSRYCRRGERAALRSARRFRGQDLRSLAHFARGYLAGGRRSLPLPREPPRRRSLRSILRPRRRRSTAGSAEAGGAGPQPREAGG